MYKTKWLQIVNSHPIYFLINDIFIALSFVILGPIILFKNNCENALYILFRIYPHTNFALYIYLNVILVVGRLIFFMAVLINKIADM